MRCVNCPICNLNNSQFLFNVDRFGKTYLVVKCRNCDLIYVNPQPTPKELNEYYSQNYDYRYMWRQEESLKDRSDVLMITKFKPQKGTFLDVGCGSGLFLLAARRMGFAVKGVDLSKKAIAYGRTKFHLNLTRRSFLKLNKRKKFDVITMKHFLEHVTDPLIYIIKSKKLLRNDGLLFLEVPNIDSFPAKICGRAWQWMTPPAHLFFFSPKTIKMLLNEGGFKVIRKETRRGDASSLLISIFIALIFRLGLWDSLKRKTKMKFKKSDNLKNKVSKITSLFSRLNFILFPLECVLNKISQGPEMVICAKKNENRIDN